MKIKRLLALVLSMSLTFTAAVNSADAEEISEKTDISVSDAAEIHSGGLLIKDIVPGYKDEMRRGFGYRIDEGAGNGKIVNNAEFFIDDSGNPFYYTGLQEFDDIVMDGEIPVDKINEGLNDAVLSKTDTGYRLTYNTFAARYEAIDAIREYAKIIKITMVRSWNKTRWDVHELVALPDYGTDKKTIYNLISEIFEIESVEESDEYKKADKYIIKGFSSETKFTDEQMSAIDELRKKVRVLSINPVVSESETLILYAMDSYNLDLSLGVNGSVFLECSEIIEERFEDGSVSQRFASEFGKIVRTDSLPEKMERGVYYSVEGENPYLAFLGYGDKIIKYTDFVYKEPRYYIDYNNRTINYCETGEVISKCYGYDVICSESKSLSCIDWTYWGDGEYMVPAIPRNFSVSDHYTRVEEDYYSGNDENSEAVTGDINSDGKVDITDLTELSLALIGDREFTAGQQKAADIDGNGAVRLPDLARLRQYLSRIIDSLESQYTVIWKDSSPERALAVVYSDDKNISYSLYEAFKNEEYKDCRFAVTPLFDSKVINEETVKKLEADNIKYEIDEETNRLILFLTIPEFDELSVEDVVIYELAVNTKAE